MRSYYRRYFIFMSRPFLCYTWVNLWKWNSSRLWCLVTIQQSELGRDRSKRHSLRPHFRDRSFEIDECTRPTKLDIVNVSTVPLKYKKDSKTCTYAVKSDTGFTRGSYCMQSNVDNPGYYFDIFKIKFPLHSYNNINFILLYHGIT